MLQFTAGVVCAGPFVHARLMYAAGPTNPGLSVVSAAPLTANADGTMNSAIATAATNATRPAAGRRPSLFLLIPSSFLTFHCLHPLDAVRWIALPSTAAPS